MSDESGSWGSFASPVVGSGGVLIREVMKSLGFVPSASGWQLAQDGSAEFNNVIVRGEFIAQSPSGAFVEISSDSNVASILLEPASLAGHTYSSAALFADSGSTAVSLSIEGPGMDGTFPTLYGITLTAGPIAGDTAINLNAAKVSINSTEIGLGYVTSAENTASLNGITTVETLALTTPVVTFAANRAFEIVQNSLYQCSVTTATTPGANFRKTNAAGLVLSDIGRWSITTGGNAVSYPTRCVFTTGAAPVSAAIAMTLFSGSGTINHVSTAGNPRRFDVNDIGPASRYPNHKVLS